MGRTGGYDNVWVSFKLGPIPFPFLNTRARVRAVRFHDLHHIVTGYDTSLLGELDISAWEVGSGCADIVAAWCLDLGGLAFGMLIAPRRMWAAFLRGRRTRNFYRDTYGDALLDMSVSAAQRALGLIPAPELRSSFRDAGVFLTMGAIGGVLALSLFIVLAPMAFVAAGPLHLMARRGRR